jgi:hypothetical protein
VKRALRTRIIERRALKSQSPAGPGLSEKSRGARN